MRAPARAAAVVAFMDAKIFEPVSSFVGALGPIRASRIFSERRASLPDGLRRYGAPRLLPRRAPARKMAAASDAILATLVGFFRFK